MATRTASGAARSQAADEAASGGTTLAESVRELLRLTGAGKADALRAKTRELSEARAAAVTRVELLQSSSENALTESAAAYSQNQSDILAAQHEVAHIDGLRVIVEKAQVQADEDEFDESVRACGARARALRDAAVAAMPTYEKHAKLAADALAGQRELEDALRDFRYMLDGARRSGRRDQQWAESVRVDALGDENVMERLNVCGTNVTIAEKVQLPSSRHPEPFHGKVHGRDREAEREREHEARERARVAGANQRPVGVYDAQGREVGASRHHNAISSPSAVEQVLGRD